MPRYGLAAPSHLKHHGRPAHPMHLAQHKCFSYASLDAAMPLPKRRRPARTAGPASSAPNNGEACCRVGDRTSRASRLPDFIVGDAIASGEVQVILKG
jgi:hypothetical protein